MLQNSRTTMSGNFSRVFCGSNPSGERRAQCTIMLTCIRVLHSTANGGAHAQHIICLLPSSYSLYDHFFIGNSDSYSFYHHWHSLHQPHSVACSRGSVTSMEYPGFDLLFTVAADIDHTTTFAHSRHSTESFLQVSGPWA